ncbi:hypothetical protein GCM10023405_17000 [Streptomonospora salina]
MSPLSPAGMLLVRCVARLPRCCLPRHPWASEVLVEQLWSRLPPEPAGGWRDVLAPLVRNGNAFAAGVREEMWALARAGALVPVGVGNDAEFKLPDKMKEDGFGSVPLSDQDAIAIDFAADQLTARLLALSKTARTSG